MWTKVLVLAVLCASALAAKKTDVTLQVLGSNDSAVVVGSTTNANANCNATAYNANCSGSATTLPLGFRSTDIAVTIDGQPASLHCDTAMHWKCYRLNPGTYKAQVKGNSIWVESYGFDKKKKVLKYSIR